MDLDELVDLVKLDFFLNICLLLVYENIAFLVIDI